MRDAELLSVIADLQETDAEIAKLEADRARLRDQLGLIVATRYHNKVVVPGYGTLALRAPGFQHRWDGRALESLVQSLRETGQDDIADEIAGCKKQIEMAGGLAITLAKPRKDEEG